MGIYDAKSESRKEFTQIKAMDVRDKLKDKLFKHVHASNYH